MYRAVIYNREFSMYEPFEIIESDTFKNVHDAVVYSLRNDFVGYAMVYNDKDSLSYIYRSYGCVKFFLRPIEKIFVSRKVVVMRLKGVTK